MYTSKDYLHHNLGVDPEIAAFFVDRKIPIDNLYWKGKYLYIASGTGYLFIPIFFDLQYRLGITKTSLLDPLHISICEAGLHSAALYELGKISFTQHIETVKLLVSPYLKNEELFEDLCMYFKNEQLRPYKYLGTFSKALNRADTYLFTLTALQASPVQLERMIDQWYALVPSFLLMDDLTDLKEDKERNEENSVNDFAAGGAGVEKAIEYLQLKFDHLNGVNPNLGPYFRSALEKRLQTPYMQSLLNNQYGTR